MKRHDVCRVVWVVALAVIGAAGGVWAQDEQGSGSGADASASTESPGGGQTADADSGDAQPAGSEAEATASAPSGSAVSDAQAPADATGQTAGTPATATGQGLVSVDFKDADIRQVLRIISLKSGVDIVAGTDVEGLVTIKLTDVPWEQALGLILRTYGFTYERQGSIVRVMTLEALEQEALSTRVFPLDYAKAKEVPDIINEMLSDRGRVKFDERTNTIIVTDIPTTLFQIAEVVERLDQRTPQVLIETRIVETRLERDEHLGIDWADSLTLTQSPTTYPSTFPFPSKASFGEFGEQFINQGVKEIAQTGTTSLTTASIGIGTLTHSSLALTLRALRTRSDTHIVNNPTLAVLNNQTARIHIGEEFPVPNFSVDPQTGNTTISGFQSKLLGTVLKVTPHVNPSEEIVVDLKPEVISFTANVSFNTGGSNSVSLPRFSTQTTETQVRLRNGETIAIGGLVKETEVVEEDKVPFLGELPILGLLFSRTHRFGGGTSPTLKQDLLIFMTVNLTDKTQAKQTVASDVAPAP